MAQVRALLVIILLLKFLQLCCHVSYVDATFAA